MSFNFGATTTPAPATNFGFGATGTASTSTPAFGANTAAVAPTMSTSLNFGNATQNKATVAPLSFGTSTAPTSTGFSGLAAATTQPAATGFPQLGVGTSTAISTATPAFGAGQTSLSFGGGLANKPTSLFGSATQPTGATGTTPLTFGTGGLNQPQTASTGLNLGSAATTSALAAPAPIGLGGTNTTVGIGTSSTSGGAAQAATGADSSASAKNQKETQIPNELLESVEEFKKFVKEERSISSDIAHASPKIHTKISEEIASMNQLVSTLMTGLSRNHALLDKIKMEAAQEILNAEIAQRTKDTPRGLQYENVAPYEFFTRLVAKFESQMVHYRRQIEETEQHLVSMASGQAMTPDDVAKAMQKLHSAFVGLAGGYQSIHEQVFALSEAFVQWHRQKFGTTIQVYPMMTKQSYQSGVKSHSTFSSGPSPFSEQDLLAKAKAALIAQVPAAQVATQNPIAGNQLSNQAKPSFLGNTTGGQTGTGLFQSNQSQGLFGTTMSPFGATNTGFQTGGKRGKH